MVLTRDALPGLLLLMGACVQTAPETGPQTGTQVEAGARDAVAPNLVRVPGATFLMGSPPEHRRAIEGPQRMVRVDEFWLARYLVTAEQYCEFLNEVGNDGYFVADTGHYDYRTIQGIGEAYEPHDGRVMPRAAPRRPGDRFAPQPGAERAPALPVTWLGATAYCRWLSQKLGCELRLPTEAEWELAARGPELRAWPWGDEPPRSVDLSGPIRWSRLFSSAKTPPDASAIIPVDRLPLDQVHGTRWLDRNWDQRTTWPSEPVGSFPRNATSSGICDLIGYGWPQWCSDRAELAFARFPPNAREPMYITRGASEVIVGYDTPGMTAGRFLRWLLRGDESSPQFERAEGRSWSRVGEHEAAGAMFRVASSSPLPGHGNLAAGSSVKAQ